MQTEPVDPYKPIFHACLLHSEEAFRALETRVEPPTRQPIGSKGFIFRYAEQTIQQAIVQKLARCISGMRALLLLLEAGLFQEQMALARVVDDMQEDVWFLSLAVINTDLTPRHTDFLKHFGSEEFEDHDDPMGSHRSRGMVRRDKIRAYINRYADPSATERGNVASRIITKACSGFVHGASPQIMGMVYGGGVIRFDLDGRIKPFRYDEFASDALNYFYRGVLAAAVAAKALGDEELFLHLRAASNDLALKVEVAQC